MVGADGVLPLPWLAGPLQKALRTQRGHALLIHGPRGIGQFELALTLAQTWLCQSQPEDQACGVCASCRLVQSRTHPDLRVLVPDALRVALGWELEDDAQADKASKTKPSKDIKVDAMRAAVSFVQTTAARGGAKIVLIHPADRMNAIAANTLLKTLEEPPGAARFILSCGMPEALLPTIRSRCQAVPLSLPDAEQALTWLSAHQVAQPAVMLAAAGEQPLEALRWAQQGIDAVAWTRLPKQLMAGELGSLASWPLPDLLDALQKLCHDALCVAWGAPPRYFPVAVVPGGADVTALQAWSRHLRAIAIDAEHPWSLPVMVEALVLQAQRALVPTVPSAK